MRWLNLLIARCRALAGRESVARDIEDELRSHIEMETQTNIERGMRPDEARAAALRSFGNLGRIGDLAHEIRGGGSMDALWQDLRYGFRQLLKSPGYAAVAILSLALGIGANTAIFSLTEGILLRRLPVKDPQALVLFNWQAGEAFRTSGIRGIFVGGFPPGRTGSSSFHYRIFEQMRDQKLREPNSPLSDLFAFAQIFGLNILADGQAEVADGQVVSGGYFAGLGVSPLLGRMITEEDDRASAPPVAVLSHHYWQERFGGDPAVIGKEVKLNRIAFTVIGVTPPAFTGTLQVGRRPDVTVPIAFEPMLESDQPSMASPGRPGRWWLHLMGRLKPGATIEQARESLDGVFQSLALEMMPPPRRENEPAQLGPKDYPHLVALSGSRGMWEMRYVYSSTVYLLLGVAGLVLLIACANVANLLLARGALRAPEITVRLAIGAGRRRLIRQLLTESLLLACLGGAVGLIIAFWGKNVLGSIGGPHGSFLPTGIDYSLNWQVLGFAAAVTLLTGIIFGLAPAWRTTRLDLTSALKDGNRGSIGVSRSRLSKGLIIVQVALSLILLVGAGLFVRSLRNLQHVDVGFNQENLLLFMLQAEQNGYKDERLVQMYRQVLERLDAIPGVRSATFSSGPLLACYVDGTRLILPGETASSGANHEVGKQVVRENYLSTMEIPLLRGRGFNEHDDQHAPKVAIISETLARKFFPNSAHSPPLR